MNYIKLFSIYGLRLLTKCFYIFPIKKNRIIFSSYNGAQFSCNPKYISEYLQHHYKNRYDLIWVLKNTKDFLFLKKAGYRICRHRSIKYYLYIATSKIYICNNSGDNEITARKNQYIIQTWHGGGDYKKYYNSFQVLENKIRKKHKNHSIQKQYSMILSSSQIFTENTIRSSMQYKGRVLPYGMPRNCLLINRDRPELSAAIRQKLNIPSENKVVLYAPTFRNTYGHSEYDLDFNQLQNALEQRFGGKWTILLRYHYKINTYENSLPTSVSDASAYPDMQELLYFTDILISDYSSSIWDFSLSYKPCFLYCTDLKQYVKERAFYRPIQSWGFPVSETNKDLYKTITCFNYQEYVKSVKKHHQDLNSYETGLASQRMADLLDKLCFGKEGK